jgi:hypothetical protein
MKKKTRIFSCPCPLCFKYRRAFTCCTDSRKTKIEGRWGAIVAISADGTGEGSTIPKQHERENLLSRFFLF